MRLVRFLIVSMAMLFAIPTLANACKGAIGSQEGQCAPNFILESTQGTKFDLASHRGKVVVVNFWATWCEPCIEELPSLERLFLKKIPGVEFVSVSMDQNQKAIERFFQRNKNLKVTFPILKDFDKKVADNWKTFKVPETYIIDTKGKVVDKIIGIRDWDDTLTEHYLALLAKQK